MTDTIPSDQVVGLRMPCTECCSNKDVQMHDKFVTLRAPLHTSTGPRVIIGCRYKCCNKKCKVRARPLKLRCWVLQASSPRFAPVFS